MSWGTMPLEMSNVVHMQPQLIPLRECSYERGSLTPEFLSDFLPCHMTTPVGAPTIMKCSPRGPPQRSKSWGCLILNFQPLKL